VTGNSSIDVSETVVTHSSPHTVIIDFQTSLWWWRTVHQPHCQSNKHTCIAYGLQHVQANDCLSQNIAISRSILRCSNCWQLIQFRKFSERIQKCSRWNVRNVRFVLLLEMESADDMNSQWRTQKQSRGVDGNRVWTRAIPYPLCRVAHTTYFSLIFRLKILSSVAFWSAHCISNCQWCNRS